MDHPLSSCSPAILARMEMCKLSCSLSNATTVARSVRLEPLMVGCTSRISLKSMRKTRVFQKDAYISGP